MSQMKRLAGELEELKHCGEILIGISDTLTEMFTDTAAEESGEVEGSNPPDPAVQEVAEPQKEETEKPAEKKQIKLPEVRGLLAEKSRAGFTKDVKELLRKHGAEKLSAVDPSEYEALMAEAAKLGGGGDA